jgi:hypothetical protein
MSPSVRSNQSIQSGRPPGWTDRIDPNGDGSRGATPRERDLKPENRIGRSGPALKPSGEIVTARRECNRLGDLDAARAERLTQAELGEPVTSRAALLTRREAELELGASRATACTCAAAEIAMLGCLCPASHDEDDDTDNANQQRRTR